MRETTFIHVKRDNNKVANLLANIGVEQDQVLHFGTINILNDHTQLQACTDLVLNDAHPLDVGDNRGR